MSIAGSWWWFLSEQGPAIPAGRSMFDQQIVAYLVMNLGGVFLSEQGPALPAGRNVFLRQNDLPPGGRILRHGAQHRQVWQMRHRVQDKVHKNVSAGNTIVQLSIGSCEKVAGAESSHWFSFCCDASCCLLVFSPL